ncbi:hypothetical protein GCM10023194_16760 [Planotetraspora phitsanulokensis]|uniref:Uncharacterized protein n=1 Tax=Planotetraspora phitsanulokensis TaxID=575192 RepID=A0A8J3U170_9ACTN|nr:hypothetical protein [Planotetraspora phitsanulokensis]GII35037.1 hypothetical protein Pph01_00400 [Planotetraspora phitsanulokensis]
MPPTIAQTQALTRVEQLLANTVSALDPEPRLELNAIVPTVSRCLDPGPTESSEQVMVSRAYWLRDIPAKHNLAIAYQVRDHWVQQGHIIIGTGGMESGHPNIAGETRPDGFILALGWAEGDHLYLAATSPCVRPDDMPGQ